MTRRAQVYKPYQPPGSSAGWHSFATCHGVRITIAYHLDVAAVVGAGTNECGRSVMMAVFLETAVHELFEAMTDTTVSAWKDPEIAAFEIADKCVGIRTPGCNYVTLANGSTWELPHMWSNAAGQCVLETK